jgi:hypothetical protein
MVTRHTPAEAILDIPGVIAYCIAKGVSPYTCSGDYTQSLGRLLELRRVADPDGFIAGLNRLVAKAGPRCKSSRETSRDRHRQGAPVS